MRTYYVTHPQLGRDAVVHAPSTEKARTVFLDYLERNGVIARGDRQQWRRGMVAGKTDEGVTASIELWYGYEEQPGPAKLSQVPEGQPVTLGELTDVQQFDEQLGMGEEQAAPVPVGMSPIAEAATRGFVR